jgi:hypothetical protein
LIVQYAKRQTTAFMTQRKEYGVTSIFSNSKHIYMPECRAQYVKNAGPSG